MPVNIIIAIIAELLKDGPALAGAVAKVRAALSETDQAKLDALELTAFADATAAHDALGRA